MRLCARLLGYENRLWFPLRGVAASLRANLPRGGTNSSLTQHANPDHPPASAGQEVRAHTRSSFPGEMCHLHVISNTGTFKTKCN